MSERRLDLPALRKEAGGVLDERERAALAVLTVVSSSNRLVVSRRHTPGSTEP
ncbi:hypothetical protein ABZ354_14640 [Streptomyces sp. NPDC005925]|uniref:hypothetical protein n=1 Tax=Streptomyces sp. NPDC005925 TaxID=3157172 RepID=UPI0033F9DA58